MIFGELCGQDINRHLHTQINLSTFTSRPRSLLANNGTSMFSVLMITLESHKINIFSVEQNLACLIHFQFLLPVLNPSFDVFPKQSEK